MAKKPQKPNPNQFDLFADWLVVDVPVSEPVTQIKQEDTLAVSFDNNRHVLALRLSQKLNADGEITTKFLTDEANRAFDGTQAEGAYSTKDAYDAMEAAFNIHLLGTESADWTDKGAVWAKDKVIDLTNRIQKLPTQTKRDEEMDEFQQFSTPPALAFVANWVANVKAVDVMAEPSAGTGDLAIWSRIAGAEVVLNELSPRRQTLLAALFPQSRIFKENAEQLDNVLPPDVVPTVIVMNPPFSSTAGRVHGQRDTANGARHIEQALKRLEEGGRLVAIVGNGMAADRPAFAKWWGDIEKKYNVRANIGIAGREYAKYGTTFDNQILVIDKTGATTQPVLTGNVESVSDLPMLLEAIRNDRQQIQRGFIKPTSHEDHQPTSDTLRPDSGIGGAGIDTGGTDAESIRDGADTGATVTDSETGSEPTTGNVVNDGIGAGGGVRDGAVGESAGSGGTDTGGDRSVTEGNSATNVAVEATSGTVTEFTDSVFSNYTPQRLSIPGAKPHPGKLVQSSAMAAVEPPVPTYSPLLNNNLINNGLLSIAQLESIVYAGQAHSELLPNGSRKGFFIGDGTGVGKGREISGIIMDNMMQGRKKALWVSFNEGLINDAKRDFSGIGGDQNQLFFQGKTKAGNEILQEDGILFTTYSTLRGGEKKQANDLGQKGGKTRAQQIIDWLGKDFDGVIAFDEAHSMGNAIPIKGKRGVKPPSQQALAGINLQRELPNARVVYVSATGATELSNLSYADRLGLWGEGTPFADVNAFIGNVSKGGLASMELLSRDMKAMGMYLARSLSYDGVSYERLEHTLSDFQEDVYNELAGAWQLVLNNVDQALEITQAGKSGKAKSAAMAQFWGSHQRFFNQVITALQTPAVIDDIRKQIDAGNVAVIQLVNTNEASQERIIADATANDAVLEDLDFTPRQMLMDYVRNGFPVAAFEKTEDSNGNIIYVPVTDSEGKQVFDREAVAMRDKLLETLQQIRVPENPLDSIINAFGSAMVAEVTGRSRRFVQSRDEEGNYKVVEEKRGKNSSRADAEAFQNDKKKLLVFSGAGGTGYSFHADNTAINQRKRIHYILQPGWRADAAVQGFGRTHRTNQADEPHYVLPTTNLKAQKRFVSSIARRLDQLGALTRGQREATSQGMFTAADNLESEYAKVGLRNFFVDLHRGKTGLDFQDVTKNMGLNLMDENGAFTDSKIPEIPQFLNRLLSLKTDQQNAVFTEFENRLVEAVEYSKQHGTYDEGLQTLKALNIVKTRDDVAYEDQKTGAQTRYVELAVTNEIKYQTWKDVQKYANNRRNEGDLSGWFVSEYGKNKGEVFYLSDIGERLDSEGKSVRRGVIQSIQKDGHKYIDNADVVNRGWEYRAVSSNGVNSYQKVTLSRVIDVAEAEKIWNEQLDAAPKTETKTGRMLVGVILPIWDRVEGSEFIYRLQTDDGEQLLGRMLGPQSAKQTLKNLGLDSGVSKMSASELFSAIKAGQKAILSNGWEIATSKVNNEDRIELKGRSSLTDAEKRVLKDQGAFVERIQWAERVFIPTGDNGLDVFERITASKPVVDLIEKNANTKVVEEGHDYGLPPETINESAIPLFQEVGNSLHPIDDSRQEVIMDKKKPFYETVAEKLIEQLKEGTAPWQRPWDSSESGSFMPYNPATDKRYKGVNALHLMSQERDDQRWLTYKQAEAMGAQVRKSEKGTGIQYWKFTDEFVKKDDNGKPVLDAEGNPVKVHVKLERPKVFYATVFNAEQIDGLPPIEKKEQLWNPIERAEGILSASGADIHHNGGSRAFYRPLTDSIHLPDKGQFPNAENYYATALHELGHWTGHSERLDRDLSHPFGSDGYAKEELRAEIASMILGDELNIGHDPSQHAAYVGSWIKALKEDPIEIFRAASDAEKIHDYVLGLEQKQIQEQSNQAVQGQDDVLSTDLSTSEAATVKTQSSIDTPEMRIDALPRDLTQLSDVSVDELRKVAEQARLEEESVKNNPGSTAEDIALAREQRKTADLALTVNEDEFKQKVAEVEQKAIGQTSGEKNYINVPFKDKDDAKALGAAWDGAKRSWYVPPNVDQAPFLKWANQQSILAAKKPEVPISQERQYLAVPYSERKAASALGAKWDGGNKAWYVGPSVDMSKLQKWLPDNVKSQQDPAMSPRDEFTEALRSVGCIVKGDHPIMDGKKHRIETTGDKAGEKAGFYVVHVDGHPAGFIQNNRTGEGLNWKAKGYALSEGDKAKLQAESATKLQGRQEEEKARHQAVAGAVRQLLAVAPPAPESHQYLQSKQARPGDLTVVPNDAGGLPADSIVLIGKDWKESKELREQNKDKLVFTAGDLLVAASDINGDVQSVQSIQTNGRKMFAAGGQKQGTFHVVGGDGLNALADAPAIVIGEGYATADTLSQSLGYATVAAFDSGNLPLVAKQLQEKYPDKLMVIAGDNDLHQEMTEGKNPGKQKALSAAVDVNGVAIFPVFAPGEQSYPAGLEKVTPEMARNNAMSQEQNNAIAKMKQFTDFNDLAAQSALGRDGVERQVKLFVDNLVEQHQVQAQQQQLTKRQAINDEQHQQRKAVKI